MSRIVKPDNVDWNWRTTDDGVPDAIVSKGGQSITPLATYTTDAAGNITGVALPYGTAPFARGLRTLLLGDSLTDNYETIANPSSASYDPATGILTVTFTAHQQATGWYVCIWNRTYAALLAFQRLAVTRVDANTFTVNVGAGLPGVPAGTLSGTTFYRVESWRAGEHWMQWLQGISGQAFNIVFNGAQSGDTTAQCLLKVQQYLPIYKPQVVLMQLTGINDMSSGNAVPEETIFANQVSIINTIKNSGAFLILLTPQPVCSPDARATGPLMAKIRRLVNRVQNYILGSQGINGGTAPNGLSGVVLIDAYKAMVDPTSTTGLALTNYLRTTDGTHYSQRGGKWMADVIWSKVGMYLPSMVQSLPSSRYDNYTDSAASLTSVSRSSNVVTGTLASHGKLVGEVLKLTGGSESFNTYVTLTAVTTNTLSFASTGVDGSITGTILLGNDNNLFANPTFATATGGTLVAGSGTCTGVAPSLVKVINNTGTPATVCTVVPRADGYGNDLRMAITPASASDQVSAQVDFTPSTVTLPAVVLAGRTYYFECELSLFGVAGSNVSEIRVNMSMTIGGVQYQTYALNGYASGANLNEDVVGLHLRSAPLVMPAGTATIVRPEVYVGFSAAGTQLIVKTGRWALREVEGN